jgi:signal peptidase
VAGQGAETASVALTAPENTGYYRRYVQESRYLAILPESVIDSLYSIHPWLPLVVIDALLAAAIYIPGRVLLDEGRLKVRQRPSSGGNAVTRAVRNWLIR